MATFSRFTRGRVMHVGFCLAGGLPAISMSDDPNAGNLPRNPRHLRHLAFPGALPARRSQRAADAWLDVLSTLWCISSCICGEDQSSAHIAAVHVRRAHEEAHYQ